MDGSFIDVRIGSKRIEIVVSSSGWTEQQQSPILDSLNQKGCNRNCRTWS
ncbi:hypothetical protein LINPERPRIM_LOCUS32725 [Linum perenne]